MDECSAYADSIGYTFWGDIHNALNPKGCYRFDEGWSSTRVYFNSIETDYECGPHEMWDTKVCVCKAQTPSPTPALTPVPTSHKIGDFETESVYEGHCASSALLTMDECSAYADSIGYTFWGDIHNALNPKGCYRFDEGWSSTRVYFNSIETDYECGPHEMWDTKVCVCKAQTPSPTPALTPVPTSHKIGDFETESVYEGHCASSALLTMDECSAYADSIGYTFWGDSNNALNPKGCYRFDEGWSSNRVYFNSIETDYECGVHEMWDTKVCVCKA